MTAPTPEQVRFDLCAEVLRRDLFEEPRIEVAGVVDEHVDAAEAIHDRGDRGLRLIRTRHVELDDKHIVSGSKRGGDGPGVSARGNDGGPAASAAFAMSTPIPRPAPVTSQTLLSVMENPVVRWRQ